MKTDPSKNPALRERPEPTAGSAIVSVWMIVVFGGLFYASQLYLSNHAGEFNAKVYPPFRTYKEVEAANPVDESAKFIAEGQKVFEGTCAACHQSSGSGKDGLAPPLAGSEWVMAPAGANRIAHAVLYGLAGQVKVKGKDYNMAMNAWGGVFDDKQIAAVLTYIRHSWGNNAGPVTVADVAAVRKEGHAGPVNAQEMEKMPEKMAAPAKK